MHKDSNAIVWKMKSESFLGDEDKARIGSESMRMGGDNHAVSGGAGWLVILSCPVSIFISWCGIMWWVGIKEVSYVVRLLKNDEQLHK